MQKNADISPHKVLAIIPARGGSKGIPNKNLKIVAGKPLIWWTIEKSLESKFISSVFVSTDSENIAAYAESAGVNSHPLRPSELATDTSKTVDTVVYLLEQFRNQGESFSHVILLEPTSPLRKSGDLDACIELLLDKKDHFDAVVTLGKVRENPALLRKMSDSGEISILQETDLSEARRQDLPEAYFPYGVAYLIKSEVLLKEKSFYPKRTIGYLIEDWQCFEIDNPVDLILVEKLVELYGDI